MRLTPIAAVAAAAAIWPGESEAQTAGLNPHGPLSTEVACSACHTTQGWSPAKPRLEFDHDRATAFPLDGRHADVRCASCHLDLAFAEPKIAVDGCAACHVDVHRGRLSADCTSCHNTTRFADVPALGIHARTSFPLSGSHVRVPCESCHASDQGGAYTTQQTDCMACHRELYASAQPVDHVAAGFSTDCRQCHNTLAWSFSVAFDHVQVSGGYALLGRHADLRCASCHAGGNGQTIYHPSGQDDCVACHQSDYDRAHAGTGFPTACGACHTNDSWSGATFADHDAVFPIFSGAHRAKWNGCETCHVTPSNFSTFTCFNCHQHDRTRMDEKHQEESGYVYQSSACYSCHPRGRAD